jgi:uncharacterized protein YkwD
MRGRAWQPLTLLVVLAALAVSPSAASAPSGPRVTYDALEKAVLGQINAYRRSHGLVPLRLSPQLSAAADQHSTEMARVGYFAHESADGSSFDKRLQRFYPPARSRYWSVGENLLWSSPDVAAAQALQIWVNSPPHRQNLLTARWRQIGISAVHADSAGGTYEGLPVTIITPDFGVRR